MLLGELKKPMQPGDPASASVSVSVTIMVNAAETPCDLHTFRVGVDAAIRVRRSDCRRLERKREREGAEANRTPLETGVCRICTSMIHAIAQGAGHTARTVALRKGRVQQMAPPSPLRDFLEIGRAHV